AMKVANYFLEYDNARAGTFAPLRSVPEGKFVVLGLVASKASELESVDFLKRRIEEASRYVKLAGRFGGPRSLPIPDGRCRAACSGPHPCGQRGIRLISSRLRTPP